VTGLPDPSFWYLDDCPNINAWVSKNGRSIPLYQDQDLIPCHVVLELLLPVMTV